MNITKHVVDINKHVTAITKHVTAITKHITIIPKHIVLTKYNRYNQPCEYITKHVVNIINILGMKYKRRH